MRNGIIKTVNSEMNHFQFCDFYFVMVHSSVRDPVGYYWMAIRPDSHFGYITDWHRFLVLDRNESNIHSPPKACQLRINSTLERALDYIWNEYESPVAIGITIGYFKEYLGLGTLGSYSLFQQPILLECDEDKKRVLNNFSGRDFFSDIKRNIDDGVFLELSYMTVTVYKLAKI